jgi:hypothetical protein
MLRCVTTATQVAAGKFDLGFWSLESSAHFSAIWRDCDLDEKYVAAIAAIALQSSGRFHRYVVRRSLRGEILGPAHRAQLWFHEGNTGMSSEMTKPRRPLHCGINMRPLHERSNKHT